MKTPNRQMQDRDTETLTWIGEMYGVRMPVLEALMARADGAGGALSRWGVRNQVDRWIDMRLAVKIDRPGGDWITLTKAGLKLAGLETLKPWGVPASGMAHTHAAAVVRLAVERQRGPGVWTCERKLRIVRGEKGHVLDGIVLTKDNRWRGIEVELTVKSWQRYADEVVAKLPGDVSELMYLVRDDPMRIRVTDRLNTAIQHIGRKVDWSVRVLPEVVGVPYIRQPSKRYKAMVGAP